MLSTGRALRGSLGDRRPALTAPGSWIRHPFHAYPAEVAVIGASRSSVCHSSSCARVSGSACAARHPTVSRAVPACDLASVICPGHRKPHLRVARPPAVHPRFAPRAHIVRSLPPQKRSPKARLLVSQSDHLQQTNQNRLVVILFYQKGLRAIVVPSGSLHFAP